MQRRRWRVTTEPYPHSSARSAPTYPRVRSRAVHKGAASPPKPDTPEPTPAAPTSPAEQPSPPVVKEPSPVAPEAPKAPSPKAPEEKPAVKVAEKKKKVPLRRESWKATETAAPVPKKSSLPTLPRKHVGFYSNHGIKPAHERDYEGSAKINQDRGMISYPVGKSSNQLLLGVYDGHGQHGELCSDFVSFVLADVLEVRLPNPTPLSAVRPPNLCSVPPGGGSRSAVSRSWSLSARTLLTLPPSRLPPQGEQAPGGGGDDEARSRGRKAEPGAEACAGEMSC